MTQMATHQSSQQEAMMTTLATMITTTTSGRDRKLQSPKEPDDLDDNICSVSQSFEDWRYRVQVWLEYRYDGVSEVFQYLDTADVLDDADLVALQVDCPDVVSLSNTLKTFLGLSSKGKSAALVQLCSTTTKVLVGLETMRRLCREYGEVVGQAGALGVLRKYLRQSPVPVGRIRRQVETSEKLYAIIVKRLGIDLPDIIRRAVMIDALSEPVLTHITLMLPRLPDYKSMRDEVFSFVDHVHQQHQAGGPSPMDVSSFVEVSSVECLPQPFALWLCSCGLDPEDVVAQLSSMQAHRKGKGKGKALPSSSSQASQSSSWSSGQQSWTQDKPVCGYCGGGHTVDRCWQKHPHLRPTSKGGKGGKAGKGRWVGRPASAYSKGQGKGAKSGKSTYSVEESNYQQEDESQLLWSWEEEQEQEDEGQGEEEEADASCVDIASVVVEDDDIVDVPTLRAVDCCTVELSSVQSECVEVHLTLDSAAAANVCGPKDFPGFPVVQCKGKALRFRTADGTIVLQQGFKRVSFVNEFDEVMAIKFCVAPVHKPLVSADSVVEKGHYCHLAKYGSGIGLCTGRWIPVRRVKGVFVFSLWTFVQTSAVTSSSSSSSKVATHPLELSPVDQVERVFHRPPPSQAA